MKERPSIIDFINHYVDLYENDPYLYEKVGNEWKATTFGQVKEMAQRIAGGLMALGVEKDDKISYLAEGRNLWIIGEFGLMYAGGISVPLSIKLSESRDLLFRIKHSDSKFIITTALQLPKVRKVIAELPLVHKIILLDDIQDKQANEVNFSDLLALGDEYRKEHQAELDARSASVQPDDLATICYTSGTTSDPKGVMLTHRNYTANVEQARSVIGVDKGDRMLIILPMDHCFAHVAGIYVMMSYGGCIGTVPSGKTGAATLRNIPVAISEFKPNVMLSVPSLAKNFKAKLESGVKASGKFAYSLYEWGLKLAISYNKEGYNKGGFCQLWKKPFICLIDKLIFSKLRQGMGGELHFFVGGGALLDIDLQRYFYAIGMPMYQGYGLSEATPIISANAEAKHILGSSGKVVKPMEIKIMDEEGHELPYGQKGEIVIYGENVMAGYWKNPEATADTIRDGWLHTGDMGYMRDSEMLYVVGRFKSLLIAADGEKYSPEGIEENMAENSKYINDILLHNNQDAYTIGLVVPNVDALKAYAKEQRPDIDPGSDEAKHLMLEKIHQEVAEYRKGGRFAGIFPERWIPSVLCILPEPFTEQNGMMNSTMKVVRGKVEKAYRNFIDLAYDGEKKDELEALNKESLK